MSILQWTELVLFIVLVASLILGVIIFFSQFSDRYRIPGEDDE